MKLPAFINLIFLLLLQFPAAKTEAQHHPILESFTATENGGKVYLNWTMISGSTCNGIEIMRSADSISFTEIGNIAGTCGSLSSPVSYQFTDDNPEKNKINYYRLELGGNGSSEIISVEVISLASGYQVRPHPVRDHGRIYFENANKVSHYLTLYSESAMVVHQQITKDHFFELTLKTLNSGLYFFTISPDGGKPSVKAKLLIVN